MNRKVLIDHARAVRDLTINVASCFDKELAHEVPPSCANCAVWNVGHLLLTQEELLLKLFGEEGVLPPCYAEVFRDGSCPCEWNGNTPDWSHVLSKLRPTRRRVEEFLSSGVDLLTPLDEPYLTSAGLTLTNLAECASFATMHEAIHLGVLRTYARLLGC